MAPPGHRLAARFGALSPVRQDVLLACAVLAVGAVELALLDADTGTLAVGAAGIAALATAFGLRRRVPLPALLLGFGTVAVTQQDPDLLDMTTPFLVLFTLPYSVARHSGERPRAALAVTLIATAIVLGTTPDWPVLSEVAFGVCVVVGVPWVAGRLLRNRALLARALAERTERLRREREAAEAQAVLAERTRVAGDLHDVITHALTAMTVQASAAGRLARRDPDRARAAFEAVERTGREALTELRRVLGVLRQADEELALTPQPSLRHLEALLARTRRAGLPVALDARGDAPAAVPAGVDLTAYRVVQAALGAARASQAGAASVTVRWAAGAVELTVTDDGRPGGRDLLGVRERVRVYDGDLQAAPLAAGGHAVRARLPLAGAAA